MCLASITEATQETDIITVTKQLHEQLHEELMKDMPEAVIIPSNVPSNVTVNANGDWIYSFIPKDDTIEIQVDNYTLKPTYRLIKWVNGGYVGAVFETKDPDLMAEYVDQLQEAETKANKQLPIYGKFQVGIMMMHCSELSLSEEIELLVDGTETNVSLLDGTEEYA